MAILSWKWKFWNLLVRRRRPLWFQWRPLCGFGNFEKGIQNFGFFLQILKIMENFEKLRIIISKVGGKFWRWEGYIPEKLMKCKAVTKQNWIFRQKCNSFRMSWYKNEGFSLFSFSFSLSLHRLDCLCLRLVFTSKGNLRKALWKRTVYRVCWTVHIFHFDLASLGSFGKSLFSIRLHLKKKNIRMAIKKTHSSPQSLPPRPLSDGRQQARWWPDVRYAVRRKIIFKESFLLFVFFSPVRGEAGQGAPTRWWEPSCPRPLLPPPEPRWWPAPNKPV